MVIKESDAGIVEDLGPDSEELESFRFRLTTIIACSILLIISLLFFYLLKTKTGSEFGLAQIIYSIVISIISLFFLEWISAFMRKNPYLGLIIGLGALGLAEFSIFQKYKGPYTTTFAAISSIIVLTYLFVHFYKAKKSIQA